MNEYVIWLPQGRLGNLLFQIQAIKYHFPKAKIVVSIDSGYSEIFVHEHIFKFIKVPKLFRAPLLNLWLVIFRKLVSLRIFSSLRLRLFLINGHNVESELVDKIPGFISNIWVIEGWFQSPFLLGISQTPIIKNKYVDLARSILSVIPIEKRVGLHMRFGDFDDWRILGKRGVTLPKSFYFDAIEILDAVIDKPVYVIFSDDMHKAKKTFGDSGKFFYFNGGGVGVDFAGMSLCSHGILSASTFALWGFSLIKNKNRQFILPKYWAGFRSEIWYPPEFKFLEGMAINVNFLESVPE